MRLMKLFHWEAVVTTVMLQPRHRFDQHCTLIMHSAIIFFIPSISTYNSIHCLVGYSVDYPRTPRLKSYSYSASCKYSKILD